MSGPYGAAPKTGWAKMVAELQVAQDLGERPLAT